MPSHPDLQRFLERQLAAFEKYRFRTNDLVSLAWHQASRVNGRPLKLGNHAFTVLLLLSAWALHSPGDFLPADDLVSLLEKNHRLLGELRLSWDGPTPTQMHAAISDLRQALTSQRLNPTLIESATQRGRGYRLSTPPMNLIPDLRSALNLERLVFAPCHGKKNGVRPPRPALLRR